MVSDMCNYYNQNHALTCYISGSIINGAGDVITGCFEHLHFTKVTFPVYENAFIFLDLNCCWQAMSLAAVLRTQAKIVKPLF